MPSSALCLRPNSCGARARDLRHHPITRRDSSRTPARSSGWRRGGARKFVTLEFVSGEFAADTGSFLWSIRLTSFRSAAWGLPKRSTIPIR